MNEVVFHLVFGCLNCDKPIEMKDARDGKQLCSTNCLQQINYEGGNFDVDDVVYGNKKEKS